MISKHPTKVIFLAGQSGSGKGTQKDFLLKYLPDIGYEVATINNGDLVRSFASKDTFVSRHVEALNKTGELVPTPILYMLVCEELVRILNEQPNALIIWDGSPRKVKEAEELAELFCMVKTRGVVIHLDTSDEVCLERMNRRKNRPEDPAGKIASYHESGNGADTMRCLDRRGLSSIWPFRYRKINGNSGSPEAVSSKVKRTISLLRSHGFLMEPK